MEETRQHPALARRLRAGLAVVAALVSASAAAAPKSVTFSDGICQYRVAFDPSRVDGKRLKATLDYLAADEAPLELGPPLSAPEEVATIDVTAYGAACSARRKRLEARRFIDDPALEEVRKAELADLDGHCAMTTAKLRAAKGDLDGLRAYAPAEPACRRYADALALPPDRLKTSFGDMVMDLCRTSTEPNVCAGYLQREGEKPPRDLRIRLFVLTMGWTECADAQRHLDRRGPSDAAADSRKRAIKEALLKRLNAKTLSCAQ